MTTWNDQIQGSVEDVSTWRWIFSSLSTLPAHLYQFKSSTVTTHFSRETTWNSFVVIWITRTCILKWSPRSRRRPRFVSSLRLRERDQTSTTSYNIQNVARKIRPFSNLIQHHPTCCKISQQGGQTYATCFAQQCCKMLRAFGQALKPQIWWFHVVVVVLQSTEIECVPHVQNDSFSSFNQWHYREFKQRRRLQQRKRQSNI